MKKYVEEKITGAERPVYVERMFAQIAPRYDVMNRLMTLGMDRRWRAMAVAEARLSRGDRALDVATGTGDLALALARVVGPSGQVVGVDFTEPMLDRARLKADRAGEQITFQHADALALPFADESFDGVTIGFGLRNISDRAGALSEMRRVVRPGGRMICLELTPPRVRALAAMFSVYFDHAVPLIGALVNGSREAYTYLPTSLRYFPDASALRRELLDAGFSRVHVRLLNMGTIAIHVATR